MSNSFLVCSRLVLLKLHVANASVGEQGTRQDSNFVFSTMPNGLYCKPGERVPLQVVLGCAPPADLVLNLFMVFDEQVHRAENVQVCPHHREVAEKASLNNRE